jgi:triacylglycerol lipase
MLARLQQFTTLTACLGALAWAAWALLAGYPAWALAGALGLLAGYAGVLALEFALLWALHGDDPTARASVWELMRAWWAEVCLGPRVFCWRQPFFSQRWPDHLPLGLPGSGHSASPRRGVLLVHGFVCNRGVWNPWLKRLHAARTPVVAVNLEPVFGSVDDYGAAIEAAVQRLRQATGMAPVVVAHSMGGLAVRRWWAQQPDEGAVHHLITIASPHQGTWLARMAFSTNGHQMRQGSPWLLGLGEAECKQLQRRRRVTCFYSPCDNIVFPPAMATLAGADNRLLRGAAHLDLLDRPEPWQELQRHLLA